MAEQEDTKKLLWMFKNQPPGEPSGEVEFDPVDAIYLLQKNTRNPYLKRAIAPTARKLERSEDEMERLAKVISGESGYGIGPSNANVPFAKRSLDHPPPPPNPRPRFQDTSVLPGDRHKLPWLINEFFQGILARLRGEPPDFDAVVLELLQLFKTHRIKIKLYEAYYQFRDWDHLMETLEEISRYPSPETFDLFCSALLTYYELVYPPEEG